MGLTGMAATFGNVLWFYFLPIYYEGKFGLSSIEIGYIYALWLVLTAIGVAPAGALADTFGRKKIIVLSSLISAASAFLFAIAKQLWVAAFAFALQGVGQAFFQVSNTLVAESIEKQRRGTAFGSYMMFTQILAAFSPAIGGFILANSGSNYFHFSSPEEFCALQLLLQDTSSSGKHFLPKRESRSRAESSQVTLLGSN